MNKVKEILLTFEEVLTKVVKVLNDIRSLTIDTNKTVKDIQSLFCQCGSDND